MSLVETETAEVPAAAGRDRGLAIIAGWVMILLVCLAVAAGIRWVNNPDAISPGGSSARVDGPAISSMMSMTGLTTTGPSEAIDPNTPPRTIDVVSVVPRVSMNTADADIVLLFCAGAGGVPSTSRVDPQIVAVCPGAVPIISGPMAFGFSDGDRVWVAVTTHHAGTVVIDGYDVTYRDGIRSGTQHGGGVMTVNASDATAPAS